MDTRQIHWTAAFVSALAVGNSAYADSNWNSAGGNLQNTRFQAGERTLGVSNVAGLDNKGEFTTAGEVSATPGVRSAKSR